jgi:RNA polymerase sigma factor (sigma-70 family)
VPSIELAPAPRPDHSRPSEPRPSDCRRRGDDADNGDADRPGHTGRPVADVPLDELVEAARAGCPGAWRGVVSRFDPGLHAVARGYGLDSASVDDAVQQTWLAAVTHLAALRESAALWGWLRRILHRECLRAVNRAGREVPVADQELGDPVPAARVALRAAHPSAPEDQAIRNIEVAALRAALRRLPGRERRLMALLGDSHERSYAEIARALDLPVGSIGPTRARCLAKLRPLLAG